jgi:hypothetical protein
MATPHLVNKKRWFEENIRPGLFPDLSKSPMPTKGGPLPDHGPRMPDPFPDPDWAKDVRAYARGKSSMIFAAAEETQVKADRAELEKALATDDVYERAVNVAGALSAQITSKYKGKIAKRDSDDKQHPGEARIQRACLSLEALLAAGNDFATPTDRKVLLLAIDALTPEQQMDLLRADEATGRRLYSALYLAGKEGDQDQKDSFAQVKGTAQLARVGSKLDSHDPSGETNGLLNGVMRYVDQAGLSDQEQNAFIDKLNFKLTINTRQGDYPDVPLPETSKDGWREKFTARTLSVLAETSAVSDESIEKALDMPDADLVKVLGNVYIGPIDVDPRYNTEMVRREGDIRLARVARSRAAKAKNADLQTILEGLDSNYLDRRLMMQEAQKGTPVSEILKILQKEAEEAAKKLAEQGEQKLNDRLKALRTKKEEITKALESKDDKSLRSELETLDKAEAILGKAKAPTAQQTLLLMKRFGRFALSGLQYTPETKIPDTDVLVSAAEVYRQVQVQVAAVEDPKLLKEGLNKSSYVLPTAGKPLKNCPWLQSTAEDLVRIATAIREVENDFTLKRNPIIVLDQTDGSGKDPAKTQLWKENDDYLKKLEAEHKDVVLTINHISMANINAMMKDSGIEKLFDTTGEGNAGYGGARNMAFLLGPVIQDAVRKGEDPTKIKPDELAKRIKASALTDAPKLFMGDDTDYVAPGSVASKAALAASDRHKDEYSLIATSRFGRDTQGVSSGFSNSAVGELEDGGLEAFTAYLFSSNKWNTRNTVPGMGCTFGEPRFCLDLPTGAEEKQCEGSVFTLDNFSMASHLSGDRQTTPSAFLKSYMGYSNMTETVKALFNVGELPWNAEATNRKNNGDKPFGNLGEVMSEAVDPAKKAEMQKSMLTKLVAWRGKDGKGGGGGPLALDGNQADKVQEYLDNHPEIDAESKDELTKIKEVYQDGKRQAKLMKDFTDRLLAELKLNSAKDLPGAIETALKDPASIQNAIKKIRDEMTKGDVKFDASNSMLRDLVLVLESVAGGGFSDLCDKLIKAA